VTIPESFDRSGTPHCLRRSFGISFKPLSSSAISLLTLNTRLQPARRALVLFLTLLLLWILVAELNHALTGLRVYLYVGGLFIIYVALTQPLRVGLAASLLAGLICDATSPTRFGTQVLLFVATHLVVFNLRDRVPRHDTVGRVVVTLLANLGLFLVFSFTQISLSPAPAAIWPRLLVDLLCSQIFIALIAPWFFALQAHALVMGNLENPESSPLGSSGKIRTAKKRNLDTGKTA